MAEPHLRYRIRSTEYLAEKIAAAGVSGGYAVCSTPNGSSLTCHQTSIPPGPSPSRSIGPGECMVSRSAESCSDGPVPTAKRLLPRWSWSVSPHIVAPTPKATSACGGKRGHDRAPRPFSSLHCQDTDDPEDDRQGVEDQIGGMASSYGSPPPDDDPARYENGGESC